MIGLILTPYFPILSSPCPIAMTTNSPSVVLIYSQWFTPPNSLSHCTFPSDPGFGFYSDQTCRLEMSPRRRSLWGFLLLTNGVIPSAGHSTCYHALLDRLGRSHAILILAYVNVNVPSGSWVKKSTGNSQTNTKTLRSYTTVAHSQTYSAEWDLHTADFCSFLVYQALFSSCSWSFTIPGCSTGFDCQKEAFMVIICFESNVRHVANNVPKGTPNCKYRLRLSCLIQQLKALDEVIYPLQIMAFITYEKRENRRERERDNYKRKPKYTHMRK